MAGILLQAPSCEREIPFHLVSQAPGRSNPASTVICIPSSPRSNSTDWSFSRPARPCHLGSIPLGLVRCAATDPAGTKNAESSRRIDLSPRPVDKAQMLRRFLGIAGLVCAMSCASTPAAPVVWYVLSPNPTSLYPHGNVNSPLSTWVQVRQFPTSADCHNSINEIHNQLHRPVSCIASNDPRLQAQSP